MRKLVYFLFSLLPLIGVSAFAQTFESTSTGADGALELTTPGVVEFDPASFVPALDPEGDNIFHFTTITIGAGVTVRLTEGKLDGPVYWLATGAVQIDGILDLNGEDGQDNAERLSAISRLIPIPSPLLKS